MKQRSQRRSKIRMFSLVTLWSRFLVHGSQNMPRPHPASRTAQSRRPSQVRHLLVLQGDLLWIEHPSVPTFTTAPVVPARHDCFCQDLSCHKEDSCGSNAWRLCQPAIIYSGECETYATYLHSGGFTFGRVNSRKGNVSIYQRVLFDTLNCGVV